MLRTSAWTEVDRRPSPLVEPDVDMAQDDDSDAGADESAREDRVLPPLWPSEGAWELQAARRRDDDDDDDIDDDDEDDDPDDADDEDDDEFETGAGDADDDFDDDDFDPDVDDDDDDE